MEASFLEIYNEAIRDLLGSGDSSIKHEIKIISANNGKQANDVLVTNLQTVAVTSSSQVSAKSAEIFVLVISLTTNCISWFFWVKSFLLSVVRDWGSLPVTILYILIVSHRSSCFGFDPRLGLRNRFSEDRTWQTFIYHSTVNLGVNCASVIYIPPQNIFKFYQHIFKVYNFIQSFLLKFIETLGLEYPKKLSQYYCNS